MFPLCRVSKAGKLDVCVDVPFETRRTSTTSWAVLGMEPWPSRDEAKQDIDEPCSLSMLRSCRLGRNESRMLHTGILDPVLSLRLWGILGSFRFRLLQRHIDHRISLVFNRPAQAPRKCDPAGEGYDWVVGTTKQTVRVAVQTLCGSEESAARSR